MLVVNIIKTTLLHKWMLECVVYVDLLEWKSVLFNIRRGSTLGSRSSELAQPSPARFDYRGVWFKAESSLSDIKSSF